MILEKNKHASPTELDAFSNLYKYTLPNGFLDFYKTTNGAIVGSDDNFVILWTLSEIIELNKAYLVDEFAPDFFIFGSDGADTAYAIEKQTGHIFSLPFIGMSKEYAFFISDNFTDFYDMANSSTLP